MNELDWLDKALEKMRAEDPEVLHRKLFGFSAAEFEQYCNDLTFFDEAKTVLDFMKSKDYTIINIYDTDDFELPSRMFLHYFESYCTEGYDESFWCGYGAHTLTHDELQLQYLFVNGQGTEHFFRII